MSRKKRARLITRHQVLPSTGRRTTIRYWLDERGREYIVLDENSLAGVLELAYRDHAPNCSEPLRELSRTLSELRESGALEVRTVRWHGELLTVAHETPLTSRFLSGDEGVWDSEGAGL
jgi:hypothetical protein